MESWPKLGLSCPRQVVKCTKSAETRARERLRTRRRAAEASHRPCPEGPVSLGTPLFEHIFFEIPKLHQSSFAIQTRLAEPGSPENRSLHSKIPTTEEMASSSSAWGGAAGGAASGSYKGASSSNMKTAGGAQAGHTVLDNEAGESPTQAGSCSTKREQALSALCRTLLLLTRMVSQS